MFWHTGHWRADSLSFMVLTALVFAEDISGPSPKTRRVASNHRDQIQADFAPPMLDHVRHFGVAQDEAPRKTVLKASTHLRRIFCVVPTFWIQDSSDFVFET